MAKLSRKLLIALKTGNRPQYKVAQAAGLHPSTLSKLVNGIEVIQANDPRVIRVGSALGLRARDLFETL